MTTTATSIEHALRRAIVPAGASSEDKRRLARLLLDLAGELEQTVAMNNSTAGGSSGRMAIDSTFAASLAAWRAEMGGRMNARYIAQVHKLLQDLAAHARVDAQDDVGEITREKIVAFLEHVRANGRDVRTPGREGRRAGGASAKTLNDYLGSIRSFLAWCVQTGRVARNEGTGIGWFGGRRSGHAWRDRCDERAFTADEVRRLIAHAPPHRAVLYRFLAETGMRVGAVEQLCRGDFELDDVDGGARVVVRGETQKRGRAQVIPLSAALADELDEVLRGLAAADRPWPRRPHRKSLDLDQVRAGIALEDERGRKAGFHAFRRFVPTELARRGVPVKIAQERLGHADPRTTLRHYCTLDQGDQARAADVLAGAMGGAGGARVGGVVVGGTVAGATGGGLRGRGGRSYALDEGQGQAGREQLRGREGKWAIQGSNPCAGDEADAGRTSRAQLFADGDPARGSIDGVLRMLLSGCTPRQAALILRAAADIMLAEAAADGAAADGAVESAAVGRAAG